MSSFSLHQDQRDDFKDSSVFRRRSRSKEYGIKDEFSWNSYPSEIEFTRDMERLAQSIIPYSQVKAEVKGHIEELRNRIE